MGERDIRLHDTFREGYSRATRVYAILIHSRRHTISVLHGIVHRILHVFYTIFCTLLCRYHTRHVFYTYSTRRLFSVRIIFVYGILQYFCTYSAWHSASIVHVFCMAIFFI